MKGIRLMKKLTIAAFAGIVVFVASCTTVERTATTTPVQASVKQYPTVADLDVKPEKVKRTENWNFSLFNIGRPSLAQRKKNLVADMVEGAKADVLVEPQYSYTKKLFGPRSLTISGYPATFKNFRPATDRDLKALAQVDPSCERHAVAKTKGDTVIKVVKKDFRVTQRARRPKMPSRLGVVAGFNMNNIEADETDAMPGFHVGLCGEINFRVPVYLTASLLYSQKGYKKEEIVYYGHNSGTNNLRVHAGYVEIPIMVGYRYGFNNGLSVFGETGPYFACGVLGKMRDDHGSRGDTFYGDFVDRLEAGWGFNVGVEYNRYSFRLGYELGFDKFCGNHLPENRNLMVGLAYMF